MKKSTKELENGIRDYCINLILNSTIEDWNVNDQFIVDNIRISHVSWGFIVRIYADKHLIKEKKKLDFRTNGISLNKTNKLLKEKHDYIEQIIIYNLLPIKELRKQKLQSINES
jgi:hypothetical protein